MSHPQAFHTSCREGLAGFAGFQMNAASARLSREQLAALATAHARYDAPRDMPYEPTKEQMRDLPVALRKSVVDGIGTVISRTEYVGQEYRRFDGGPDEGRYGNHFCHLVVGSDRGPAFGGATGIELWDAPHWTTRESVERVLPELDRLQPGPLTAEDVLATAASAPAGVVQRLLTLGLEALHGGSPVVAVDPDPRRAPAWIALISHCLPPGEAAELTFSTYEGRPRDIFDLHVIVTTPACDPGPAATTRIAVTEPQTPGDVPLYARVVSGLLADDPAVLRDALRDVTGASPDELGASLAVRAGRTDLVADAEVGAVLRCIGALVTAGDIAAAAEGAGALATSTTADRESAEDWLKLHIAARRSTDDGARDLAGATLARLAPILDALPAEGPGVAAGLPTAPGVGGLGAWLRTVEAEKDPGARAALVRHGVRLRLLGVNVPVDRRAGAAVAEHLAHPEIEAVLGEIAADPELAHIVTDVVTALADEAPRSPDARDGLIRLAHAPHVRRVLQDRAAELQTFDAQLTWQRARVAIEQVPARDAADALILLVADARDEAELRTLWGADGPQGQTGLRDLLDVYVRAGRPLPAGEKRVAFRSLMLEPLPTQAPPPDHIGWTLAKLPAEERRRPELLAWGASFQRPSFRHPLTEWCGWAAKALAADQRIIPDERWNELAAAVAEVLLDHRIEDDFPVAMKQLGKSGAYEQVCQLMGRSLQRDFRKAKDPVDLAVREFTFWMRQPELRLTELMLPATFERFSQKDIEEIHRQLEQRSAMTADAWVAWTRRHPRQNARDKAGRVFGRLGSHKGGGA